MRTSGTATESRLTVAILVVALGLLVLLAGGPTEFLKLVEAALESAASSAYQAFQGARG